MQSTNEDGGLGSGQKRKALAVKDGLALCGISDVSPAG